MCAVTSPSRAILKRFLSFIWLALERLKKLKDSDLIFASDSFPFCRVSLYQSRVSPMVGGPGLASTPSRTNRLFLTTLKKPFSSSSQSFSSTCNTEDKVLWNFCCFWIATHLRSVITFPTNGKKTEAPPSSYPRLGCHGWSNRWSCSTKRPARRTCSTTTILRRSVRAAENTSGCFLLDLGPELFQPIEARYCSSEFPISTENKSLNWNEWYTFTFNIKIWVNSN